MTDGPNSRVIRLCWPRTNGFNPFVLRSFTNKSCFSVKASTICGKSFYCTDRFKRGIIYKLSFTVPRGSSPILAAVLFMLFFETRYIEACVARALIWPKLRSKVRFETGQINSFK